MKNCTQGFFISNMILVQTPVKLSISQIHENCQLWYNLNYINLSQGFQHIFEIHIIGKIFLKYIDPVTTLQGGKKNESNISKMKVLHWHQCKEIHCYENLRRSTNVHFYYILICIFMHIRGRFRDFEKGGSALCWPSWWAGEENFRFWMV